VKRLFQFGFFTAVAAIEYLATTPLHFKVLENTWDKANHFTAFFVLYGLLKLGFGNLSAIAASALLLLYGVQIEVVQSFLPYREFSLLDVVADSVGIFLGFVALRYLIPKQWVDQIK